MCIYIYIYIYTHICIYNPKNCIRNAKKGGPTKKMYIAFYSIFFYTNRCKIPKDINTSETSQKS